MITNHSLVMLKATSGALVRIAAEAVVASEDQGGWWTKRIVRMWMKLVWLS